MSNTKRNGYHLQHQFDAWKIHNQGEYKSTHVALFTSLISLNNKLKWVENFGVPRDTTKMQSGITNNASYTKALEDLNDWGLINIVQRSKNQFTATVICLVFDLNVSYKEIDGIYMDLLSTKTMQQDEEAVQKPSGTVLSTVSGTVLSTVPISKQLNNQTTKQIEEVSMDDNGYPINPNQWVFDAWDELYLRFTKKKTKTHMLSSTDKENLKYIMKELNYDKELLKAAMVGLLIQELGDVKFKDLKHLLKDEGVNIQKYINAQLTGDRNLYTPKKKIE